MEQQRFTRQNSIDRVVADLAIEALTTGSANVPQAERRMFGLQLDDRAPNAERLGTPICDGWVLRLEQAASCGRSIAPPCAAGSARSPGLLGAIHRSLTEGGRWGRWGRWQASARESLAQANPPAEVGASRQSVADVMAQQAKTTLPRMLPTQAGIGLCPCAPESRFQLLVRRAPIMLKLAPFHGEARWLSHGSSMRSQTFRASLNVDRVLPFLRYRELGPPSLHGFRRRIRASHIPQDPCVETVGKRVYSLTVAKPGGLVSLLKAKCAWTQGYRI